MSFQLKKKLILGCGIATATLIGVSQLYADTSTTTSTTTPTAATSTTTPTAASSSSTTGSTATAASGSSSYLQLIAQYTYGTMQELNSLPLLAISIQELYLEWQTPTTVDPQTTTLQGDFTNYTALTAAAVNQRITTEQQMMQDLFGANPASAANVSNLYYFSTYGLNYTFYPSLTPTSPSSSYNFIKNVAGMSMTHVMPDFTGTAGWSGKASDQQVYTNFYNTITAIESFNAYLLTQVYTDNQNENIVNAQQQMMNDASNSAWYEQVATNESLSTVLRQSLLFNAQIFVLLTQLLQTEKEVLAAQSMTNTMLVLTGATNEQLLLRKAVQTMPGG